MSDIVLQRCQAAAALKKTPHGVFKLLRHHETCESFPPLLKFLVCCWVIHFKRNTITHFLYISSTGFCYFLDCARQPFFFFFCLLYLILSITTQLTLSVFYTHAHTGNTQTKSLCWGLVWMWTRRSAVICTAVISPQLAADDDNESSPPAPANGAMNTVNTLHSLQWTEKKHLSLSLSVSHLHK